LWSSISSGKRKGSKGIWDSKDWVEPRDNPSGSGFSLEVAILRTWGGTAYANNNWQSKTLRDLLDGCGGNNHPLTDISW